MITDTVVDLEREWSEANEAFKRLDARYKEAQRRSSELRERAQEVFEARTRSDKELLHDELMRRQAELRSMLDQAIEQVRARATQEIGTLQRDHAAAVARLEAELEPRIAEYREITVTENGYEYDAWEDYDPEEEFHSPEYDALLVRIDQIGAEMSCLSEPRNQARRRLNEARARKLTAQRAAKR